MDSSDLEIKSLVVGVLEGNCYIIKCDSAGHGIIIDPGDQAERISDEAKAFGLKPQMILLTHGHIDHTNAAAALKNRFGSAVVCHHLDASMVRGEEGKALWGFEREPCSVDREVEDGQVLKVGGCQIRVLHTPGHTRGSVCYIMGDQIFTGDTLFQGSIGRTDLPGGSEREMKATLANRIATLDEKACVWPGHGPSTTIGEEKRLNPFLMTAW
ncbi:MAG: MBL fold metallo-hydrolase [Candidatus Eisenbacteria bacterium]